MRILHTADWHIGNFPGPESNGKNLRLLDTLHCLDSVINIARCEKPDLALVSGDIFHQARVWADRGLSEVQTAIENIRELAWVCPVVVLRGTPNHDGGEQFDMLAEHFNNLAPEQRVWVVDTPDTYPIMLNNGEVINVACLPGFDRGVYRAKFPGLSKEEENQVFTDELKNIVFGLKAKCDPRYPSVLMAHYTVPGSNVESGQTQFLAQFEPVIDPDTLDGAAFDLVALGHIHRPQQVPSCRSTFYSGAINAMNFNDEGQERGFYIHDLNTGEHEFFKTPYRPFVTYHFTDTEITAILNGDIDDVAYNQWKWKANEPAVIDNAIVRILYTCSEEKDKAFNRSLLERRLYDDGAFWVQEITAEKVTISTDKNSLSEKTDPERNLVAHLKEKGFPEEKIGPILEAARPIIAEAMAGNITSQLTGTFVPLEIEVKNYRNYAEEHFSFHDISFCTVNGVNGAGKSSLFMDAILDCLYEEPREGDLTGWIRSDESARSGSISFTFAIGEKTYRVTRTRAKSGKATLNLAELVDGGWVSRSAEKIRDTQQRIIDTLGMDSLTFRACALIMQDQYGLFLQAAKEDRMNVLGNILGLGIYGDMEQLARDRLTEVNRKMGENKALAASFSAGTSEKNEIITRYEEAKNLTQGLSATISEMSCGLDAVKNRLSKAQEAAERASKLAEESYHAGEKAAEIGRQIESYEVEHEKAMTFLKNEAQIITGAADYGPALEAEKAFAAKYAELTTRNEALKGAKERHVRCKETAARLYEENKAIETRIESLQTLLARERTLKSCHERYLEEKERLKSMEGRSSLYISLSGQIAAEQERYHQQYAAYSTEAQRRNSAISAYQEKAEMLENSECVDPENAKCVFLADARNARAMLDTYLPECAEWKVQELNKLEEIKSGIATLTRQREELGYNQEKVEIQRDFVSSLETDAKAYEQLGAVREQLGLLESQNRNMLASIAEAEASLKAVEDELSRGEAVEAELTQLVVGRPALDRRVETANMWAGKEKELPAMREKKAAAERRIQELNQERVALLESVQKNQERYVQEIALAHGREQLEEEIKRISSEIAAKEQERSNLQIEIGGLHQRLEQFRQKEAEITQLLAEAAALGEQAARYSVLKSSFSQDGVPHNIVRSMLPVLSSTANSILSQMTGGHMGVSFVTDKVLKSNSKKEVPTLDIVIEEYGKGSLPYLSKSGGEKVKASLAVILALAEVKSSQAGIRLGMLFIDEPPFLDAEGTQAYCDALETIQRRYESLKVMAITHDPSMKARFPQSVDVVKTENGSKVSIE